MDRTSGLLLGAAVLGVGLGLLRTVTGPGLVAVAPVGGEREARGAQRLAFEGPEGAAAVAHAAGGPRAPSAPPAWLRFLDRETSAPLDPAELTLRPAGGDAHEELRFVSDVAALRTEQLGRRELRVRVPGYVPLAGSLDLEPGENRVLLEPAGSLGVRLLGPSGDPVEGIAIELVPPLGRGDDEGGVVTIDGAPVTGAVRSLVRTAQGWTRGDDPVLLDDGTFVPAAFAELAGATSRRTDSAGRAVWSGLPAGDGYRWRVAPPTHVEVAPPHEQRRLQELGEELRTGAAAPRGVSGRFEIAVAERLELEGTLLAGASVRGRVACDSAVSPARVSLYRVRSAGGNTAKRAVAFDSEQTGRADPDGSFLFTELRPATWMVRAWWEEEGRTLFFACRAFRLQPGAELDLGVLHPLRGDVLEVSLGIVDQDDRPLEPARVYTDPEEVLFANLSLTALPASGDAADMVSGFLALPFGETFRVHGLQPGRVYASLQPGQGLRTDASWVSGVEATQPAGFEVGSTSSLELALVARVGVGRELLPIDPSGAELPVPNVWVRAVDTGAVSVVQPSRDGARDQELTLPPGTYDLWCRITTSDVPQGLVGGGRVDFDAGGQAGPIEVPLRPAASISGVLRDPDGAPVPGHRLSWSWGFWPAVGESGPLYGATTDDQGRFELNGIPPGARLRGAHPGTDLPVVNPGVHGGVELVLSR